MTDKWFRFEVPGRAVGKGRPRARRMGPKAIQLYTDAQTLGAEQWVRQCMVQAHGQPCLSGPILLVLQVHVLVPASWPQRRRYAALTGDLWPTGKPDLDNVLKMVSDALNGIAWLDDSQVVEVRASKRYAEAPKMIVEFRQVT